MIPKKERLDRQCCSIVTGPAWIIVCLWWRDSQCPLCHESNQRGGTLLWPFGCTRIHNILVRKSVATYPLNLTFDVAEVFLAIIEQKALNYSVVFVTRDFFSSNRLTRLLSVPRNEDKRLLGQESGRLHSS
jgi:hypothetical protein